MDDHRICTELLDREVRGHRLPPTRFGDLIETPTFLVFLRHFG